MPRPADPNAAVAVLVRVSEVTARRLKELALEENRSMAAVVRDMLRDQLDIRDPERDQLALDFTAAANDFDAAEERSSAA